MHLPQPVSDFEERHIVPGIAQGPAHQIPRINIVPCNFDDSEETFQARSQPFKGFFLCSTGVNDKASLFKLASKLGAQSYHHLTDRVTHLIAEEPGSRKYYCALEIGIPIMHPSWIVECHEAWLRGEYIDVAQSIEDYRLPQSLGMVPDLHPDNFVKDSEVWLPDGNVVIISQNTAFRIHESILALHDVVLYPVSDEYKPLTFEGCPAVMMSDSDTPEDVRRFLLVLCCGKDYYHENDEIIPVPCDVLCSLIRMGHEFGIQKVLDDALSRLKKYYTSDLSAWEDGERRAKFVTVGPADHLLAIQAAYLTNTPSILPTAFLEMCHRMEDHIMTLSTCDAACQCDLTPDDVVTATVGRAALTADVTARLLAIHASVPALQCPTPERCALVAQRLLQADMRSGIPGDICTWEAALKFQPLYMRYWGKFEDQLCASCRNKSRDEDERLRKSAWKNLPQVFGLEVDDWPASV